jgi:hypothetical protein
MFDSTQSRHPPKQIAHRALGKQAGGEIDEGAMYIVLGNCSCNAIDVRCRQFRL